MTSILVTNNTPLPPWYDQLAYPAEYCGSAIKEVFVKPISDSSCCVLGEVIKRVGIFVLAILGIIVTGIPYVIGQIRTCCKTKIYYLKPEERGVPQTQPILQRPPNVDASEKTIAASSAQLKLDTPKGIACNHFFESTLFREKIVSQCKNHLDLHAIVGVSLLILQLVKDKNDELIVYKALSELDLEEIKRQVPEIGKKRYQDTSVLELLYKVAIRNTWDIAAKILFPNKKPEECSKEDNEAIKGLLKERLCVYFHGTNSTALKKIAEHGMRGDLANDQEQEIKQLRSDLNDQVKFGFYGRQKKAVFYFTRNPEEAFHYAKGSPEWFQSFLSNGNSKNNPHHYFRYEKRNEQRVNDLFAEMVKEQSALYKWTAEQETKMHKFYKDNWERFGRALPVVIAWTGDRRWFESFLKRRMLDNEDPQVDDKSKFIDSLAGWFANIEHGTDDKPVPPQDLRCYLFPLIKFPDQEKA